jgi:hypothetical protein
MKLKKAPKKEKTMNKIQCNDDIFSKRIRVEELGPDFQAFYLQFTDAVEWANAGVGKFGGYCKLHDIRFESADERVASAFLAAAGAANHPEFKDRINVLRRKNQSFRNRGLQLVLPLDAPREREHARKKQFATLSDDLKAQFDILEAAYATHGAKAFGAIRRLLLRLLKLATESGLDIKDLPELWAAATIKVLDATCYGVSGARKWKESHNAAYSRYRLLLTGRKYALFVRDEASADRLDRLIARQGAPRGRNTSHAISSGAKQFRDKATVDRLKEKCEANIREFRAQPNEHTAAGAIYSANALLQLGSGQRAVCIVRTAAFNGAIRVIPGTNYVRPLLTLTKKRKKKKHQRAAIDQTINVEDEMKEPTRVLFDQVWLGLLWIRNEPPVFLNAKKDGNVRSESSYSTGVRRIGESIDIPLSPGILRIGVVIAMKQDGRSDQQIADALGIRQIINFKTAFSHILKAATSQNLADAMDAAAKCDVSWETDDE